MLCGYVVWGRLFGCLISGFLLCIPSIFPILSMLFCFYVKRFLPGWWSTFSWLLSAFGRVKTRSDCGRRFGELGRYVSIRLIY